ncbi:hypothetical protein YPPY65_1798, partial [Yersinia pestis PY-65]
MVVTIFIVLGIIS